MANEFNNISIIIKETAKYITANVVANSKPFKIKMEKDLINKLKEDYKPNSKQDIRKIKDIINDDIKYDLKNALKKHLDNNTIMAIMLGVGILYERSLLQQLP